MPLKLGKRGRNLSKKKKKGKRGRRFRLEKCSNVVGR